MKLIKEVFETVDFITEEKEMERNLIFKFLSPV
jgi:hypothetical protein